MKYEYLTNIPLETALKDYLAALERAGMAYSTELVRVESALGRVSAGAVYARLSSPHYNACAMDGVALSAKLTFNATATTPVELCRSEYIPVDTGDPLPNGCDAVVMIEDVVERGDGIALYCAAAPWQHIRKVGEDISAGDMLLCSYTKLTPSMLGALLAGGVAELEVIKRPLVAIIPTGDEVVAPSASPREGEVMEFNSAIFSGMITEMGGIPKVYPIVRDEPDAIAAMLSLAASECDAVLLCAGTSAGRDDNTKAVIGRLGDVILHGIAIKPGKPAVLGAIGPKPVVGVPGYPVSGIIVLDEIFRPVMRRLTMDIDDMRRYADVKLSRRVVSSLKYEEFIRARLADTGSGLTASPIARGAGVVTSFVKADCIVEVPQNSEGAEAGDTVRARLLRPPADMVITGSHDPLMDELADILMRERGLRTASAHVGSMGGITAAARGECMAAGTHLFDEASGEYNLPFIKKAFPNGGAALFGCVYRIQGLMVKRGNPKGIRDISDLAREGISFVNRQRGSGTRTLLDHLMRQRGVSPDSIYGYAREEYTHTAVAAQVALDADAGLGIYSAAHMMRLDFLPVCEERYDILIPEAMLDMEAVRAFLRALGSKEFENRLMRMGGYRMNTDVGRIL